MGVEMASEALDEVVDRFFAHHRARRIQLPQKTSFIHSLMSLLLQKSRKTSDR